MISFPQPGGLVVYLTCGDPNLCTTRAVALAAIDSGANVVELGVPFSDPVADGPVIQRASERALKNGTSLHDVLQLTAEVRAARPQAGLIIFSYFNPILQFGLEKFAIAAKTCGANGVLVTDLIVEEADDYIALMRRAELATVFLAAPTSTDARLRRIAKASRGFVYAISRTGITGAQVQLADDAKSLVQRLRRFTKLPIAVGFGISNSQQYRAATEFANAAVVGSAIVELIERSGPEQAPNAVAEFIHTLKGERAAREETVNRAASLP